MALYTDIEPVVKRLTAVVVTDDAIGMGKQMGVNLALEILAKAPLVEAEPVVHAHWIPCGQIIYGGWNRYNHYCSHCGIRGHTDFKRCPECGAHMDEEVAE